MGTSHRRGCYELLALRPQEHRASLRSRAEPRLRDPNSVEPAEDVAAARVAFAGTPSPAQVGSALGAPSVFVPPSGLESFGIVVLGALRAGYPTTGRTLQTLEWIDLPLLYAGLCAARLYRPGFREASPHLYRAADRLGVYPLIDRYCDPPVRGHVLVRLHDVST